MLLIKSRLPLDRFEAGEMLVERDGVEVAGPYRARGEADNTGAAQHHNSVEDPTKAYGDHPGGRYLVTEVVETSPDRLDTYGPYFLRLDPIGGEALLAKLNGRTGIGIHGGRVHSDGRLRETYGCLRVDNSTIIEVAGLVRAALAAGEPVEYECEVES